MRWLARFRRRVRLMIRRDLAEREMDDEMRFHLDMEADELTRFGATARDAQRLARLQFGGVARYKDEAREARFGRWWEELRQDVRYASRTLVRSCGFAAVAMATLALGIGANTAIFSVVESVLLRPLPYARPAQLVAVASVIHGTPTAVSPPDFMDWRRDARSFSQLAAYFTSTTNLTGNGEAERLTQARVTANFFDLLGVQPVLGRGFRGGEDDPSAPRVGVLSDGLWRRRFGADRSIIGRTIILDDVPTTIIGVAPPHFPLPADDHAIAREDQWVDLWLTTRFTASDLAPSSRGARWVAVIGRLARNATIESARAEMTTMAARLAALDPRHDVGVTTLVQPLHEELVGGMRTPLLVLLGAAGFVLLIACVNVASLSFGRAAARETELAVRVALGADRQRITRQLLTESLVLSLGGGVAGVLLAVLGTRALVAAAPGALPVADAIHLDGTVLGFALALTVASGLLFGVVQAVHGAARSSAEAQLRAGGRGALGAAGGRARQLLVIAEVSLAIVLLAGAALLLRSFERLTSVDPGFRAAGVSTFSFDLSPVRYPGAAQQAQFGAELLARLERLPGVSAAGLSFGLPLSNGGYGLTFAIAGRPEQSGTDEPRAQVRVATPDYFRTMGIPVLRGRGFTTADRAGTVPVIVVSAEAARRYWPNEDPIGQTIATGWRRDGARFGGTIVGVVGDVRQFSLADPPTPEIYAAFAQWPLDEVSVVVRSTAPAGTVLAAASDVVRALDPQLPLYDSRPLDDLMRESVASRRFYALLLATFAALALTLAAIGIYGVIAYSVQQRRRELGIRVALGASRRRVIRLVMGQGMRLAVVGAALGIAGATLVTRVLRGQLFGIGTTDPATFVAVPLLLLVVAAGACVVPVLRALRVDPATAIRAED
jgi:putative ABC transport system permease protein